MNIFILGTDTGVGKTVLSLLFMKYLFMKGENPFYIKPFQTGCDEARSHLSDARFIYDTLPELKGNDPSDSVIYCFPEPKAPYFAARNAGVSMDTEHVVSFIKEKEARHKTLVIEAAGGVFVPVDAGSTIIDLVQGVNAMPVVAARAGLGTINHTLLTIEALQTRGLNPAVVFLDRENTDPVMIMENREAVEMFKGVRVAGVIGNISDFTKIHSAVFDVISEIMESFR